MYGLVGAPENTKLLDHPVQLKEAQMVAQKYVEAYKTDAQIEKIRQEMDQYNKSLEAMAAFQRHFEEIKGQMELHQKEAKDHAEQHDQKKAEAKYHYENAISHRDQYVRLKTGVDSMAEQIKTLTQEALHSKRDYDFLEEQLAEAQKADGYLEVLRRLLDVP